MSNCWGIAFKVIVCLGLVSVGASAQEPVDRPAEIGVESGGETSWINRGGDLRVTVTIPRSGQRAIEGFVGVYRSTKDFDMGLFGVRLNQPIAWRRRTGVEPYASLGLMALVGRYATTDCLASCRPHTSVHVTPPFLALAGVGIQYAVTPRLTVRLESEAAVALVIPLGIRVAAGVSIPLGRPAANRRVGSAISPTSTFFSRDEDSHESSTHRFPPAAPIAASNSAFGLPPVPTP